MSGSTDPSNYCRPLNPGPSPSTSGLVTGVTALGRAGIGLCAPLRLISSPRQTQLFITTDTIHPHYVEAGGAYFILITSSVCIWQALIHTLRSAPCFMPWSWGSSALKDTRTGVNWLCDDNYGLIMAGGWKTSWDRLQTDGCSRSQEITFIHR